MDLKIKAAGQCVLLVVALSFAQVGIVAQEPAMQDVPPPPRADMGQGMGGGGRREERVDQADPFLKKARLKMAIEAAEKDNDKMKSESLQVIEFVDQLHDAVVAKSLVTDENLKRLTNIEKLTKDIRDKSGGTQDKDEYEAPPQDFAGLRKTAWRNVG